MTIGKVKNLPASERRIIRAWCMYDWANSGYATSGGAAIFPVYFVFLFKDALGESVTFLGFTFTGSSTWSLGIALATAFVALSSPVLGVLADRVAIKKVLLWIYTIVGSLFTLLMFFSAYTGQPWLWFLGMFILANIGFAGCLVFYNALLPHIAPRNLLDEVSSRGFAYGYIGGGLLLAVHLVMIVATEDTAWADLVTRLAIASVGLWWFGWALWTLKVVPEPPIPDETHGLSPGRAVTLAFRELAHTFGQIRGFRVVAIYLVAYLLFNDGLQTVLNVAGAYGADTIGIPLVFNMATILIIQFVGAAGAMGFSWLAGRTTTKAALAVSLAGWSVVVLLGVGVAPLEPKDHEHFDYQLTYVQEESRYLATAAPPPEDSAQNRAWRNQLHLAGLAVESGDGLVEGDALSGEETALLLALVAEYEDSAFGVSVRGGELDGRNEVGRGHPSVLGDGPIDWWPETVRRLLWAPLGLAAGYQWLLLGVGVGLVMGGSQALARSLFAQIVPHARSGEFFSFFGFMGRVSSIFGPLTYVVVAGLVDTRVAILSILILIVAGGIVLKWVNVLEGARVADEEDARHTAQSAQPAAG